MEGYEVQEANLLFIPVRVQLKSKRTGSHHDLSDRLAPERIEVTRSKKRPSYFGT